jgi:histidinol-phosphate aminotransferase
MEDVLRLHLNESPYGPPPAALEAAREEVGRHTMLYPESDSGDLRRCIADHLDVPPEMVAVGNGVDELVLMAALAFSGSGSTVVMTDTTFPGYLLSAEAVKATSKRVPLKDLCVSAADLIAAIKGRAALAYLCNPHNPTGTLLGREDVDAVVTAAENADTVLVVDEAYMDFADDEAASALEAVRAGRQVVVLRTFSKAWGLASLRMGYAVGPAHLIAKIWQARRSLPFNVNRLAQHAIPAALRQTHFLEEIRRRTADARELLYSRLEELDMRFVRSATNFVMVETPTDSSELTERLADEHHILVRDLTLFGLSGWIRVTVGTPEEIKRLATALQSLSESAAAPAATGESTSHSRTERPGGNRL